MIIAGVIIVGFIGMQFIIQQLKIKVMTEDYHILERRYQRMESSYLSKIDMLNIYNTALQEENSILKNRTGQKIIYQTTSLPDGVLDAVKIAMKVSHPDNGGKTADFIKYNELYKKLSK